MKGRNDRWSVGLFDCFQSPNRSGTCCFAHCCCQPCVWSSALNEAGVENASVLGVFVCCGGRGVSDEFAGYLGRRALVKRYGIQEDDLTTVLVSCFLGPCGRVQEVDTIVERENLVYRPLSVKRKKKEIAPVQATMVRSTPPPYSTRV